MPDITKQMVERAGAVIRYGILVLLVITLSALCAYGEFSADLLTTGNGHMTKSRFYYSGHNWRMEEKGTPQGKRVTIFREDRRCLILLFPEIKRYMIQNLPEKEFKIISSRKPGEEIERTDLGKETVSGYETVKSRVKYRFQNRMLTGIEWYSKDLGVIVRSRAEDNTWSSELVDIKEGGLDKGLFEIPPDYKQLSREDIFKEPKGRPVRGKREKKK